MPTALIKGRMAAKKRSDSDTMSSVRLDADMVSLARIVAAYRNISISEVILAAAMDNLQRWEKDEVAKRAKMDQKK